MTDLNTYIDAERTHRQLGAKLKKAETVRVFVSCVEQKIKRVKHIDIIRFSWFCKDKRKDKDNVAFAKKFILDGMMMAKVIKNDGWNDIDGFVDIFAIDNKNPRVEVEIN